MSNDIELVPVRRDAQGNVREWRVERPPAAVEPAAIEPAGQLLPAQPVRASAHVESSYSDRAKGFSVATWQMSSITGIAAFVAGQLLVGFPFFSLAALAWILGGYFVTWLIAYGLHVLVSAEGADFYATVQTWRYIREEQQEQQRRYWHERKGQ